MNISKVIGIIEDPKGPDSARIKVISFKKDGVYVTNPTEIKTHFPKEGFVFAPHIFQNPDYKINSLIEFSIIPTPYKIEDGEFDEFSLNLRGVYGPVGFLIFTIDEDILINKYCINQPILRNFIHEESSHFYIKNNGSLFGPFKNSNGNIIPTSGMEVNKYSSVPTEYQSGDKLFLLVKPADIIAKIDCMTQSQLVEWFKKQTRNQQLNIENFDLLKKALESQEHKDLDHFRIKRVLNDIDQLSLSISELKILANSSENLNKLYTEALNKANTELKDDLIEPLLEQKTKLKADIFKLMQNIKKVKKEETDASKKSEATTKEYDLILKEKDRLIEDIRVHSLVHESNSINSGKLITYEEQVYETDKEDQYNDLNEFIRSFSDSIDQKEYQQTRIANDIILQFKDYKCFLSDSIGSIIQIAKLSNNCKVVIQQVEPDWLKFECLYKNGLKQVWESAYANNDMLHFLILEDINIASIECFAKPVLDINLGLRIKLPGHNNEWPKNLWIFAIPLSIKDDYKFGLPLIKSTFKNWGAFTKTESPITFKQMEAKKILKVEKLFEHDIIIPISLNDYFPE